jgi:glycosyltransferase involved in cell wall biosynthesis
MISIAIPVYEMGNYGVNFLQKSLEFISKQTYSNFEVIISDHSINNTIEEFIRDSKHKIDIKYFKNHDKIGNSSANINFALNKCQGEIIKILFQDEFLYDGETLQKIVNSFKSNPEKSWLLTGCLYGENVSKIRGKMNPIYSDKIINGVNTIGSPSVISILNKFKLFFDENIIWLMDCDYYKKCYDNLGEPIIINEPLIFVSQHDYQLTNIISSEKKTQENTYIKNKYKL